MVVPVFENVGERSTAKNYHPVSHLSMVSKVIKTLINIRLIDYLEKCGLFSDFQYGFSSSQSSASPLTTLSKCCCDAKFFIVTANIVIVIILISL